MASIQYSVLWYFFFSFTLPLVLWLISKNISSRKLRPPGPPGWPLIGNIFDVGKIPHQNMYKLRSKYGPVLWLKLGFSNTLVIQSAKAAEELFKKHDFPFSDRRLFDSLISSGYYKGSLTNAPYGDYWRKVRKLSSSELLSHKKVSDSALPREHCVNVMLEWIKEDVESSSSRVNGGTGEIQLDMYLILMAFNFVGNFVISRDIMNSKSEKGNEFLEAMNNLMEWTGKPNLVDSFPFLKWLDPQGIRKNTEIYMGKLINMASSFVKERIQYRISGKVHETKDFLDALLDHVDELSEESVTVIILDMFFAGTESTSSAITWGMTELLRNPDSLKRVKSEMELVIGKSRAVEESDLNKLPYLQATVKEIMRLHPSLPFLLPRNAMEDTTFMGYIIPKDTMVLVNAWAIHRDPDSWDDPLSFKPERFINSNIDSKGQHFELIPFGSGRRSCIGMLLGEKMVSLTLAKLIQTFDWKLPDNVSPNTMDMREKPGLAVRMLVPLKAIPV